MSLALAVTSCLPLEDLSEYRTSIPGSAEPTADPPAAVAPLEPGTGIDPGQNGGASEGSGEGFPSTENTGLAPSVVEQPPVATVTPCGPSAGASCDGADASVPESADAGPPLPVDGVPDAGAVVPPPACALEERAGPNGNCYVTVATPLAWADARVNCQNRGAGWDLATIRSREDSVFLDALVTQEAWAGGADEPTEGTWAWVTDGAEFWAGEGLAGTPLNGAFNNWFLDEPNGEASSNCLRILADGTWADLECTALRAIICEGPPG